jgi:hypothetical protein
MAGFLLAREREPCDQHRAYLVDLQLPKIDVTRIHGSPSRCLFLKLDGVLMMVRNTISSNRTLSTKGCCSPS